MLRLLPLWIAFTALNSLGAQDLSLDAPTATERAAAESRLGNEELLTFCRQRLDTGGSAAGVIRALDLIGRQRDGADIARILKYIDDLDAAVATAAMDALRQQGTAALKALRALDDKSVDRTTRKQAVDQLLQDHVYACCRRDLSINPFRLNFESRFHELYAVGEPVDDLLLKMLRDLRSDIRDDISGQRNYYGFGTYTRQRSILDVGGLAVAALARSMPEKLMEEMGELARLEREDGYYYGWNQRTPVTMELAIFFARQGNTSLCDRLISEMESSMRWGQPDQFARTHVQIAALQITALAEPEMGLERINDHIKNLAVDGAASSQAHYLRARVLMQLGEEGAALRALEDSMETSDFAMVMTLVDSTFKPLASDRRFQAILRYCELASRRMDVSLRPWRPVSVNE